MFILVYFLADFKYFEACEVRPRCTFHFSGRSHQYCKSYLRVTVLFKIIILKRGFSRWVQISPAFEPGKEGSNFVAITGMPSNFCSWSQIYRWKTDKLTQNKLPTLPTESAIKEIWRKRLQTMALNFHQYQEIGILLTFKATSERQTKVFWFDENFIFHLQGRWVKTREKSLLAEVLSTKEEQKRRKKRIVKLV